jgi:hypothetical protein
MPPMDKPPVSPQAQAQMGPPGGPAFGQGIGQAQQQMEKSPAEIAVSTVEKILMGVGGNKFPEYARRAIAILKVGLSMEQQQGPESGSPMGKAPQAGGGQQQPPLPPMPGQMPG